MGFRTTSDAPGKKPSALTDVLRMLAFLKPVRVTALIASSIVVARILFEVASVHFLSPAISGLAKMAQVPADTGLWDWLAGNSADARHLRFALGGMAVSQVILTVLIYLRQTWDAKLSMRAVYHMRQQVYDSLQNCGFSLHDRVTSGNLINRALSDLQAVRAFVNMSLLSSLDVGITIFGYVALLFVSSPWLGGALLGLIPLWWFIIRRFGTRLQLLYQSQQDASDKVMNVLTENIGGVHVVRAFGTGHRELKRFSVLNEAWLGRILGVVRLQQYLTPAMQLAASLAHAALFMVACWLIRAGAMPVGDLLVLGVAMGTIVGKLQQVNTMSDTYQKAAVSARRLFEILDTRPDVASPPTAAPLVIQSGTIAFDRVSFGYEPKNAVLDRLTAIIPGNRMTALVGPTGCGKSTLAALIGRFYDPRLGRVLIDGQDLRQVDLKSLHHEVGYVFQETFLFADTVRNNIAYGRPDVSDDMLRAAARAAQAEEFIAALPRGYDTVLGDNGVLLSGGQRQRLALARALVYDPRILILDDATAALDATTEQALHRMLKPLFAQRTVIVIAHKVSTVRRADYVLVMNRGRIVQGGTHDDLMKHDGHYRDLVHMQLDGGDRKIQPSVLYGDAEAQAQ